MCIDDDRQGRETLEYTRDKVECDRVWKTEDENFWDARGSWLSFIYRFYMPRKVIKLLVLEAFDPPRRCSACEEVVFHSDTIQNLPIVLKSGTDHHGACPGYGRVRTLKVMYANNNRHSPSQKSHWLPEKDATQVKIFSRARYPIINCPNAIEACKYIRSTSQPLEIIRGIGLVKLYDDASPRPLCNLDE